MPAQVKTTDSFITGVGLANNRSFHWTCAQTIAASPMQNSNAAMLTWMRQNEICKLTWEHNMQVDKISCQDSRWLLPAFRPECTGNKSPQNAGWSKEIKNYKKNNVTSTMRPRWSRAMKHVDIWTNMSDFRTSVMPHSTHPTVYTLRPPLYTPRPPQCTLSAPHFTLYAPHNVHSPASTLHSTLFRVYTPRPPLYTLHLPQGTVSGHHFTLYAPHLRPPLYTLRPPQCTLSAPHSVHSPPPTLHSMPPKMYSLTFQAPTLHSTPPTSAPHSVHSPPPTLHSSPPTMYTLRPPLHSTPPRMCTPWTPEFQHGAWQSINQPWASRAHLLLIARRDCLHTEPWPNTHSRY